MYNFSQDVNYIAEILDFASFETTRVKQAYKQYDKVMQIRDYIKQNKDYMDPSTISKVESSLADLERIATAMSRANDENELDLLKKEAERIATSGKLKSVYDSLKKGNQKALAKKILSLSAGLANIAIPLLSIKLGPQFYWIYNMTRSAASGVTGAVRTMRS